MGAKGAELHPSAGTRRKPRAHATASASERPVVPVPDDGRTVHGRVETRGDEEESPLASQHCVN